MSTFSQKALAPLRREQDPEIQQKVIATVESAGNLKHENYGTERKMKAVIDRFHDVEPDRGLRDQIFRLEHEEVDLSTFSEAALAPLRREQDPEIQQKVLTNALKLNDEDRLSRYGTERKMKAVIDRFHDVELEKPKPKTRML